MKSNPSYIVLVMRGDAWESLGPLVVPFVTKALADIAAQDLSARFPQRTFGVYRLQTTFATEQKLVRQNINAESPRVRSPQKRALPERNLYKFRAAE